MTTRVDYELGRDKAIMLSGLLCDLMLTYTFSSLFRLPRRLPYQHTIISISFRKKDRPTIRESSSGDKTGT